MADFGWALASAGGLVMGLTTFLLGLRGSDWSPLIVMASVPVQRELMIGRENSAVTLTQCVLACFVAAAIIRLLSGMLGVRIDAVMVMFGAVAAIYALSILVSDEIRPWAAETYRWGAAALFLLLARAYFDEHSARRLLIVLGCLAGAAGIWAVAQVWRESGPPSFSRSGWQRAYGGFGEPNPFAAFAWAVALPVLAYALLSKSGNRWRLAATSLAGVAGIGTVLMTQSRGGVLGLAAGLAVIAIYWLGRRSPRWRVAGLSVVALGAGALIAVLAAAEPWGDFHSSTTPSNWADQERTAHWSAALEMTEESPWLGVGGGGFENEYRSATQHWRFRISQGHAHNAYLQIAAEAGLGALVAYLALAGAVIGSLARRARAGADAWLEAGVLAVTVALIAHQLVDYLHVLSLGLLFAGLWAAALVPKSGGVPVRERNVVA